MGKDLLWQLGEQYLGAPLDPQDCDPDPFVEVRRWLRAAVDAPLRNPNAMTLATVDGRGRPAARIVLLKGSMIAASPSTRTTTAAKPPTSPRIRTRRSCCSGSRCTGRSASRAPS